MSDSDTIADSFYDERAEKIFAQQEKKRRIGFSLFLNKNVIRRMRKEVGTEVEGPSLQYYALVRRFQNFPDYFLFRAFFIIIIIILSLLTNIIV